MNIDMVNAEIQKEVSKIVNYDIKDPRLTGMVSILRVDTTNDLKYCKINVSVMGDEQVRKDTYLAIESAKGYIRRELAHRLRLRTTPELIFIKDDSIDYSIKISKILEDIKKSEQNK